MCINYRLIKTYYNNMSYCDIVKSKAKIPVKSSPLSYIDILKKGIYLKASTKIESNSSSSPSSSFSPGPSSSPSPSPNCSPIPRLITTPSPPLISSSVSITDSISDSDYNLANFNSITFESECSKSDFSDSETPISKYEDIENIESKLENKIHELEKEKDKKLPINENNFLNPNWKLPGGKKYQKDGVRLENAFYNGLPKRIKNNVITNVKPKSSTGNVIVEFDMIYQSDSLKRIISFEIKGVNPNTINNLERQKKLILQGIRQKKYLDENFSGYKVDCVYCFVTGKIKNNYKTETDSDCKSEWKSVSINKHKSNLDYDFIRKIKSHGLNVSIGETPQQCAKNALLMLGLLR